MEKNIEIELRSIFTKEKYDQLLTFLTEHVSNDLWEDDKNVFFFIMPDKLLKVVDNTSKQSAKIVLKLNKIGQGSHFEEIEIPIAPEDVNLTVHLFTSLGCATQIIESFQKRHNFIYKGIEIALKYSEDRWYHAELEILIDDLSKKAEAEKQLYELADELDIQIMTDEELKQFTDNIEKSKR